MYKVQAMYKVRATKRDEGGYDLSYGKGKKKVIGITKKDPSDGRWFIDTLGHFKKVSDLKKAWGKWAAEQYNGASKASGETVPATQVPSPPPPPPPPPSVPKRKPKGNGLVPLPPVGEDARKLYVFDPMNPQFRYPELHADPTKRGKYTALGMLVEVQAWHERYKERIADVNHKLALTRTPGFNPFAFLRMMIDETIELEFTETLDDNPIRTAESKPASTEVSGDQRTIPPCP